MNGGSFEGQPIELLTIGHGARTALFLKAPHRIEPIGVLTLEFLSRLLCERADLREQLDCTFLYCESVRSRQSGFEQGLVQRRLLYADVCTEL